MLDAELAAKSGKYAQSPPAVRALVRSVVKHVQEKYALTFTESENGHLQFPDRFLLIEIRPKVQRMVLDLYSRPESYAGLGVDSLMVPPRPSETRLAISSEHELAPALSAIDHAWMLKQDKLKKASTKKGKKS